MKLKKSILFWSLLVMAAFLAVSWILSLCGLKLRVWLREPLSFFTGVGAGIGILQLLLHIPKKGLKIFTIVLWSVAAAVCLGYSWLFFGFYHLEETAVQRDGKWYIEEYEHIMWASNYYYYEDHGPLVRGAELLDEN